MNKVISEFIIVAGLFIATFFLLSRVDWVSVLNVKKATLKTEEKLGSLFWEMFSRAEKEIKSDKIRNSLDSLVDHLCKKNSIDKSKIKLHVLEKDEINAFTLPDDYLVVYSGLINASENEAELLGVLGHEIAHMEKGHVMKKLIKEIGLSALISMTSGGGGEAIKEAVKLLSSSAYDRDLEREADITSVDYLINANIDPEAFANFLYRLSDREKNIPNQVFWISTHPDSKERAENIIEYIRGKDIEKNAVLTKAQWDNLKATIADLNSSQP